jgi:hypothetical protein
MIAWSVQAQPRYRPYSGAEGKQVVGTLYIYVEDGLHQVCRSLEKTF